MPQKNTGMVRMALSDVGLGIIEVSTHLGRFMRAGFGFMGQAFWRTVKRIPSPLPLIPALGAAALWGLFALLWLVVAFSELPTDDVDLWVVNRPPSITVLDRNGDLLGTRNSRYGDPVDLDALPPFVVEAFIATEDRRFFQHHGFDLRGVSRAFVTNVRAGGVVEGGSTMTQQLARNLFLNQDRTLRRKVEELQLAIWLEARLTKEEILSLYINRTYLGGGTFGIEAASNLYFGKSATELSLAEAAIIAGLPKAPSSLAPTNDLDASIARSYDVLDNMVEADFVDPITAEIAKLVPPEVAPASQSESSGYFLDYILSDLHDRFGTIEDDLIVETTLDAQIQLIAQDTVATVMDRDAFDVGAEQAALIAFDDNGGIVAMIGGRSYFESNFNRAAQAMRQPGSAFKPFVFLAALESGLTPETVVIDQPIRVGAWQPRNYSEEHGGAMRLATAVARSTNSIAVQVSEVIGRDRVIDAARRSGITRDMTANASIALGTVEMPLLELTAAYLPFGHRGREMAPHAITRVQTRRGRVLYEFAPIDGFHVIEPDLAQQTTRMLMRVMNTGTGRRARLSGHQSAAKTGTTNDWRDAWFIGYTSHFTTGVWVGNDAFTPMDEVTGSTIPLDIWHDFMTSVHEGRPARALIEEDAHILEDVTRLGSFYEGLRDDLVETTRPVDERPWWRRGRGSRPRDTDTGRSNRDRRTPVQGRPAPGLDPQDD